MKKVIDTFYNISVRSYKSFKEADNIEMKTLHTRDSTGMIIRCIFHLPGLSLKRYALLFFLQFLDSNDDNHCNKKQPFQKI